MPVFLQITPAKVISSRYRDHFIIGLLTRPRMGLLTKDESQSIALAPMGTQTLESETCVYHYFCRYAAYMNSQNHAKDDSENARLCFLDYNCN